MFLTFNIDVIILLNRALELQVQNYFKEEEQSKASSNSNIQTNPTD